MRLLLGAVIALLATLPSATPTFAGTQDHARVALHIRPHSTPTLPLCGDSSPVSEGRPCSQFVTAGEIGKSYDIYVVIVEGDSAAGVSGLEFRVDYNATQQGHGWVSSWVSCADREFPSTGDGPHWPAPGSTNLITWSRDGNCQRTTVGNLGVHAVVGVFTFFTYTENHLVIEGVDGSFQIVDCAGSISMVDQNPAPFVAFSPLGTEPGAGPCSPTSSTLRCAVTPTEYSFGELAVGDAVERTFSLTNTGVSAVDGALSVTGEGFTLLSEADPFHLEVGQSRSVRIRALGIAPHGFDGILELGTQCGGIPLHVDGAPQCWILYSETDFQDLFLGEEAVAIFGVANRSHRWFTFNPRVTGPGFSLVDSTGPVSLPGRAIEDVLVRFRPVRNGVHEGVLDLGGDCDPIALIGDGKYACTWIPASCGFGSIELGTTAHSALNLMNRTSRTVSDTITVTGTGFEIEADKVPYSIPPMSQMRLPISFRPTSELLSRGLLRAGWASATAPLTGTGYLPLGSCDSSPRDTLDFGRTYVGKYYSRTVRFTNTGNVRAHFEVWPGDLGSGFWADCSHPIRKLAPSEFEDVRIAFRPTQEGLASASLTLLPPCSSLAVVGTAVFGCPTTPDVIDLGTVDVGRFNYLTFKLTNYTSGTATGDVHMECDDFRLDGGGGPYTLAREDNRYISISFVPQSPGLHECAIAVGPGCPDSVHVRGRGVAAVVPPGPSLGLHMVSAPGDREQRLVYVLPEDAPVRITVFDVAGRETARFEIGDRPAGTHEQRWDAGDAPAGIYFARITAGRAEASNRFLLLR